MVAKLGCSDIINLDRNHILSLVVRVLESGLSYKLFYLYPMILMMSGRDVHPVMLVTSFGVYLLTTGNRGSSFEMVGQLEGILMILLAMAG